METVRVLPYNVYCLLISQLAAPTSSFYTGLAMKNYIIILRLKVTSKIPGKLCIQVRLFPVFLLKIVTRIV